jgi:hypothetical protein
MWLRICNVLHGSFASSLAILPCAANTFFATPKNGMQQLTPVEINLVPQKL